TIAGDVVDGGGVGAVGCGDAGVERRPRGRGSREGQRPGVAQGSAGGGGAARDDQSPALGVVDGDVPAARGGRSEGRDERRPKGSAGGGERERPDVAVERTGALAAVDNEPRAG